MGIVSQVAKNINDDYQKMISGDLKSPGNFYENIAKHLDDGFQKLNASNLDIPVVDISVLKGTLVLQKPDNTPLTLTNIGLSVQNYWTAATVPGTIATVCAGGTIISVVNTATVPLVGPDITSKLTILSNSMKESKPYFESMVKTIFDAVFKIVWIVSETNSSGCASSYSVSLSE